MPKDKKKPVERVTLEPRPLQGVNRKTLRKVISERHSKALEYLAK